MCVDIIVPQLIAAWPCLSGLMLLFGVSCHQGRLTITPLFNNMQVLLFFTLAWVFWRYSLLYVYVRKYESGGLMVSAM